MLKVLSFYGFLLMVSNRWCQIYKQSVKFFENANFLTDANNQNSVKQRTQFIQIPSVGL